MFELSQETKFDGKKLQNLEAVDDILEFLQPFTRRVSMDTRLCLVTLVWTVWGSPGGLYDSG